MKQSSPLVRQRHLPSLVLLALAALCMVTVAGCGGRHQRTKPAESLSEDDRAMLQQYETFRSLLAQDDLRAVRRAAANLQKAKETGESPVPKSLDPDWINKLATASGLEQQREAFRVWSIRVIALTDGVQGFYLIHCPLPNCGDWVQRTDKVENPYMGKSMRDCGEVQK